MRVDKSVLEKLSDYDLERYIKEGNRYVKEANIYAYEILKSRGKTFSEQENERIQQLIKLKHEKELKENENRVIHANYKKASDLMYLSGALAIAAFIWNYETLSSGFKLFVAVISVAFVFGIAYLISKGTEWMKYLLLILLLLGILGSATIISHLKSDPVMVIINLLQTIVQVWALVLLFKIPKTKV